MERPKILAWRIGETALQYAFGIPLDEQILSEHVNNYTTQSTRAEIMQTTHLEGVSIGRKNKRFL